MVGKGFGRCVGYQGMAFVPPGPTVVSAGYFLKPVLGVGCGDLIFLSSRPFSPVLASQGAL